MTIPRIPKIFTCLTFFWNTLKLGVIQLMHVYYQSEWKKKTNRSPDQIRSVSYICTIRCTTYGNKVICDTVNAKPDWTPISILNSKNRDGCPIWFRLYSKLNKCNSKEDARVLTYFIGLLRPDLTRAGSQWWNYVKSNFLMK